MNGTLPAAASRRLSGSVPDAGSCLPAKPSSIGNFSTSRPPDVFILLREHPVRIALRATILPPAANTFLSIVSLGQ